MALQARRKRLMAFQPRKECLMANERFSEPRDHCQDESEPQVEWLDAHRHVPGDLVTQAWGSDLMARNAARLPPPLWALLAYIYSQTGRRGRAYTYLSNAEMAEVMMTSPGRVRARRKALQEAGWIRVEDSHKRPWKNRVWFNSQMLFELMEMDREDGMPLGKKYVKKDARGESERVTQPPLRESERVTPKDRDSQRVENRDSQTGEPAVPAAGKILGEEIKQRHSQARERRIQKKLARRPVSGQHLVEWWRRAWNESRFGRHSASDDYLLGPKERGQLGHLLRRWRRPPEEIGEFFQWVLFDWGEVLDGFQYLKRRPEQPSISWVLAMAPRLMEMWDVRKRGELLADPRTSAGEVRAEKGWDRHVPREGARKKARRWRGVGAMYEDLREDGDDGEF